MSLLTKTKRVITMLVIALFSLFTPHTSEAQQLRQAPIATPITETGLLCLLRNVHRDRYGADPTKSRLAMAWAQVASECGRGQQTSNHNVANIGAPKRLHQPYYVVGTHRYRHFTTFTSAIDSYWSTVHGCRAAMAMFDAGDPRSAATYLKACGYFEADVGTYATSMAALYRHAIRKVIPDEDREREQRERDGWPTLSCSAD